jgi:hypothetical protein
VTDSAPASPEAAPKKPTRRELVARLRRELEQADPGTLAALRRFNGDTLPPPAFYRLTVGLLDEHLAELAESKPLRDDLEVRWAVIVASMAAAQDFLGSVPLGEAMAMADVAEMRVLRLLEANHAQLPALVRNIVHQLVQRGKPFDPNDIADLVLAHDEKAPRSRIARSFYRHEGK